MARLKLNIIIKFIYLTFLKCENAELSAINFLYKERCWWLISVYILLFPDLLTICIYRNRE